MRYGHTNLIARDWKSLSRFYVDVFGCIPLAPERDLRGDWLDRATGITGAHLRGVHLRLPGHGPDGPTLEIFTYDSTTSGNRPVPDRTGFGHIAFRVPDVHAAAAAVLAHGGSAVGDIVDVNVPGAGPLTWAYVRDPEGNIVELQRWGGSA
jgi:catechol 2,3-dioxygenase-like lactoylglutathione lyase family enzyme